ncbi:MAG TPA: Glu-tRNA(Gln) amidotransferase subunit GatE [Candidatus Nanoarchaeia archaeon]|nr:Glu-tRNA(Gln) amidotransferase subunit GatE [Candidatus Nanoarchaeia archaeon]
MENKEEKIDYEKLKFKSGLEIHQQLQGGSKKLFCNCPSFLRTDEPDYRIQRRLHAVAGESGKIDKAAEYQHKLGQKFVYEGYNENNCLIELDESPPREINKKALETALHVALHLNCKILPVSQIMRKTVIDGSNTGGFQRTVLIAHGGYVETPQGKVGIDSICLEEDSARKISTEKDTVKFRLDRLGIPLIEIATSPDIKSPEQAKEVALYIGEVLRSCDVKRGIGTIRQDVNISIREGNRIELKGMQDMKTFLKIIENEVKRQKELSDKKEPTEEQVRNANQEKLTTEYLRPMPGAARMYPETDLPLLKMSREFINKAKKTLPKLKSEIQDELKKQGLNKEMIKLLLKQNKVEEYKTLLQIYNNPNLIAKMILVFPQEIASKTNQPIDKIKEKISDSFDNILEEIQKGNIQERDIKTVLENLVSGKKYKDAIKIEKLDTDEIEEKISKIIKEKPGLNPNAYMGLVMKDSSLRGKVDGKTAMEIIKKYT